MSYTTPNQHEISSGILLDAKIAEIQEALDGISWLQYSFARAYKHAQRNVESGAKVYFPAVYQNAGKDYLNVFPNDNLTSQSFVYVRQPQTLDFYDNGFHSYTAEVSIIVVFRLDKISTAYSYNFTELLKYDMITALNNIEGLSIGEVYDEIEEVYNDFTVSEIEAEFLSEQFGALRFDCSMTYSNDCIISNTY